METVFLGLGSNLHNPAKQLQTALSALDALDGLSWRQSSPVYRSPAMVLPGQSAADVPDYLNLVAEFDCQLSPQGLLQAIKQQELQQGRDLGAARWSSRPIDIDILLFGQQRIVGDSLTVPHVGIADRDFVLLPWCDISPDTDIPALGSVADCARTLENTQATRLAESLEQLIQIQDV